MASSATMRVDGDTSGLSAALGNVTREARGIGTALARNVPILGQMTTTMGPILLAAGAIGGTIREWSQGIERGNRSLDETLRKARELAGATGDAGRAEAFRVTAMGVATEGVLDAGELMGAAGAFRDSAPRATVGQTSAAMRSAQTAGTAGIDSRIFSQVLGVIVASTGMSVGDAADYAAFIVQNLGAGASQAVQDLPRLLDAGMSLDDAVSLLADMRGQGIGQQTQRRALSALARAGVDGVPLTAGNVQSIIQRDVMRDFRRQDTGAPEIGGFLSGQREAVEADEQQRQSIAIQMQRNRIAMQEQQRADLGLELAVSELAADDAARGALGRMLSGIPGTRNIRARAARGDLDAGAGVLSRATPMSPLIQGIAEGLNSFRNMNANQE